MKNINLKSRTYNGSRMIFIMMLLLFFVLRISTVVFAKDDRNEEIHELNENELFAKAAVLMDAESGRVLYGKNENLILPMASTTKIMTCILALEHCDLDEKVKVSEYASKMPDVQLHIKEGEEYFLRDLLYSLMLESHNDVAVAIAEHVSGSVEKFAELMNQKAMEIGCRDSCFLTPNGLDATARKKRSDGTEIEVAHSTTAKDLATIMSYCILESPMKQQFLEITSRNVHEFSDCLNKRNFSCHNHNALLIQMSDAISGKTGFTSKAGYCYVGAVENDGRRFVVALLACGWPYNKNYKWKDCRKLFHYGKENYERVKADYYFNEDEIPESLEIKNGQFPLGTKEKNQIILIKLKEQDELPAALLKDGEQWDVKVELPFVCEAPVTKGQELGRVIFSLDGEIGNIKQIVATEEIKRISYCFCFDEVFKYFLKLF